MSIEGKFRKPERQFYRHPKYDSSEYRKEKVGKTTIDSFDFEDTDARLPQEQGHKPSSFNRNKQNYPFKSRGFKSGRGSSQYGFAKNPQSNLDRSNFRTHGSFPKGAGSTSSGKNINYNDKGRHFHEPYEPSEEKTQDSFDKMPVNKDFSAVIAPTNPHTGEGKHGGLIHLPKNVNIYEESSESKSVDMHKPFKRENVTSRFIQVFWINLSDINK